MIVQDRPSVSPVRFASACGVLRTSHMHSREGKANCHGREFQSTSARGPALFTFGSSEPVIKQLLLRARRILSPAHRTDVNIGSAHGPPFNLSLFFSEENFQLAC